MPDQQLIGDRHAWSEADMLGLRPTRLIRDQHTCLIGDTFKTDMSNRRPTRDRHARLESYIIPIYINK